MEIWGFCTNGANFGCRREGRFGLLPPIKSGKITSVPSLRYGIVEVRARIPQGDWLWPVIWMLPRDRIYGAWPRSGEIDIMVSRGNTGALGVGTVTSTLHWGTAFNDNKFYLTLAEKRSQSWHDSFHIWKLEWRSDRLITFVDNEKILEVFPDAGF
ncbi:Beta-1,3-glucan-binding protein [Bulinus truncatus]|nr:Beta-1,3-glucan-binding protein [Bulinus truncatus]